MESVDQHVETYSDWMVKCFATENLSLDYSIESLKHLDKFLADNVTNGVPNPDGILREGYENILYGMGIYLGETFRKTIIGSKWVTIDNDGANLLTGEFSLANGTTIFPLARVAKRFENGEEDGIYPYGLVVVNQMSNDDYWENSDTKANKNNSKKWWRFW